MQIFKGGEAGVIELYDGFEKVEETRDVEVLAAWLERGAVYKSSTPVPIPKPVVDWIAADTRMPADIRALAVVNYYNRCIASACHDTDQPTNLADALRVAFGWASSAQGYKFWEAVVLALSGDQAFPELPPTNPYSGPYVVGGEHSVFAGVAVVLQVKPQPRGPGTRDTIAFRDHVCALLNQSPFRGAVCSSS